MSPNGGVPAPECLDNNTPKIQATAQSLPTPSIPGLAAPAPSYNPNPGPTVSPIVPTRSLHHAPSLDSVAPSTRSSISYAASKLAIVARTFIPKLTDELHIAPGEQMRILNEYDDGWALCSNSRGDMGVVPLECLQRSTSVRAELVSPQQPIEPSLEEDPNRNSSSKIPFPSSTPNTMETY